VKDTPSQSPISLPGYRPLESQQRDGRRSRSWISPRTCGARQRPARPPGLDLFLRGSAAVDYTVNTATGFPLITGPEELNVPVNHVLPAWDVACRLYSAVGLLAAVRRRESTGIGCEITLALADAAWTLRGTSASWPRPRDAAPAQW